ncbi:putative O-methyltransferase [Clostridium acetireducens DSM 10703]|jgi:predicted O-methyltransferase YrrM|uniref:tRNA 5-hydroxyuridine methyltransferase n=1 Tax=Clostridium acetireducens DSM 10703 TaxID=1121290 RepID=A0A1E8EXD3_9CLOT|nr:O-methyltransferase [Clostridium acetireducens]OFI05429.1 putative O-methyltransferase [Clostridium acetireducens DSM 10703]
MSGITFDYMEQYIRNLIGDNANVLKELEDYAVENSVPIIHKEVARFIELIINIKRPLKILELGTAIGYSSILMCSTSKEIRKIHTIERDKNMIEIANENIKKYGFQDKIKVISGECLDVLSKLDEKYDLIFMDAGKGHYNHFLPYCLNLLEKDGIIIADNVLFRGMVACDKLVKRRKITIVKRMRKYLEMVSNNKEFITSIIPMGDGIAVTIRRNKDE